MIAEDGQRALGRRGEPWRARGWQVAIALQSAGFVLALARPAAWLPACAAMFVGTALLLGVIAAQARLRRRAAQLSGAGDGAELSASLAAIGMQLDGLQHRADRQHPVTGLRTREHLLAAIAEDIAAGCGERVLGTLRFADYDRLSDFHPDAANPALAAVAARLKGAARPDHVLAQVDRDSFAIWFRGTAASEEAIAEFHAIAYAAMQELPHEDTILTPSIEAGLVAHPEDGDEAQTLLTRAIVALSPPERDDAGGILLKRRVGTQIARERYALEQDLRRAIEGDQLRLVFQPVVDVAAGRIVSAEALLRWDHPTLGAVSPAHFIPIVEATGQSERYGAWVLNAALREARAWRAAGVDHLRVAVNLSACQLLDSGLLAKVERTLALHGLPPQALELELTETAAMTDAGRTLTLFRALHGMGVSLAIDDFGSGYSSLSYLKNLPFDKLKIDREFVREVHLRRDSLAICRALVELSHGLDLRVLAEGTELREEVDALRALGCTLFQGYYFARPLEADAFLAAASDPHWVAAKLSVPSMRQAPPEERLCA